MNRRDFLAASGMTALCCLVGCKPKAPYDLVPIQGVAKYQGAPLPEGFQVQFEPEDGTRASFGMIKEGGTFEVIHTASQKGVKPGPCAVSVIWLEDPAITPVPDEYVDMVKKYGFQGTDKLKFDISKPEKNFEINFE